MTAFLLGTPQQLTSVHHTHDTKVASVPAHLDRGTGTTDVELSTLLAIARELAHGARQWPAMGDASHRVWNLLAASADFEAWIIGWPAGGGVELHDHGESSGAVVVAQGELVELVVTENDQGALATTRTVLPTSASLTFDMTHVHEIVNEGPGAAVSVHVYAPRLTAMTYYEFSDGLLETKATVHYELGAAIP